MAPRWGGVVSICGDALYHTYDVPVEGSPHARQCRACGERQRYNPPTGQGRDPFVMVDESDLRELLRGCRSPLTSTALGIDGLCDRLERLLGTP